MNFSVISVCAAASVVVTLALTAPAAFADEALGAPFTIGVADAPSLRATVEARIAHARSLLDSVLAVKGRRTVANTLTPYDELSAELHTAATMSRVLAAVHPDEQTRQSAEELSRTANAFSDDLQLRPDVYDALRAIRLDDVDGKTRYYIERELRDFRLAGVDKPAETRQRISQLRDQLTAATAEFQRNLREGSRTVTVASAAALAGLPADFIARHKPDASGAIVLTTDAVDSRPVLVYAESEDLRRRMYIESQNVAYPKNDEVLGRILQLRWDLAHALGYANWAAYDTASRMSGTAGAVSDFIDRVVAASAPGMQREYAAIAARKQQDRPDEPFHAWDRQRYSELVRRANYDFDSQSVRPYFAFDSVMRGVLDISSRIFGVTFRRAEVPVWHPSVLAYEMLDGSRLLGRVYLDLHPRANKDTTGATTYLVRLGKEGRQIPESVLVASVSGGQSGDPGLMTHEEVRTLFHEFGHVMHRVIGGHQPWHRLSSAALERDFAEVPSQMLEEWIWDPATLATFARHYQTGEPIPPATVRQMRRASEFGKALDVRQQMVFARMSLSYHDRDRRTVDATTLGNEIQKSYMPYPQAEGAHREAQFSHLANAGYASTYYTYMWSMVIAKDMFGRFDATALSSPGAAKRFRETVFEPGSSKPAATLVRDFLGRPFDFMAWQAWLNSEAPVSTPTQ